jgi:hypothetical protein
MFFIFHQQEIIRCTAFHLSMSKWPKLLILTGPRRSLTLNRSLSLTHKRKTLLGLFGPRLVHWALMTTQKLLWLAEASLSFAKSLHIRLPKFAPKVRWRRLIITRTRWLLNLGKLRWRLLKRSHIFVQVVYCVATWAQTRIPVRLWFSKFHRPLCRATKKLECNIFSLTFLC